MTKASDEARNEAIEELRRLLPPGTIVWTILRHVSQSGMSRDIDVYHIVDGSPRYLSGLVATAGGFKRAPSGAIRVGGAGMDMGFHLVYSLSRTLYADNFRCIGKVCPSSDHTNDYGEWEREFKAAHPRLDELHGDPARRDPGPVRDEFNALWGEYQAFIVAKRKASYRRSRKHSDGGYALKQAWL